jgi:thioredoxin 1
MPEIKFNDKNFEAEVLKSDQPVLVDFYADWCGPCRMLAPIIEELSKEFEGKAKIGKLSTEDSPEITQKYSIMSIPALKIFKKGKIVWEAVGLQQKAKLVEELKKHV